MDRESTAPLVTALDHVQLAMPEGQEASAERFYCDVLGFTRISKPADLEARGGCWFESNGVRVHLGVEPDFVAARKAHPAFVVSDLQRMRRRLEDAKFSVVEDTQLAGFERFYSSDPFGNRIEFLQPVKS